MKREHAVSLSYYVPLNYLPCHPLPDLRDVFQQIDTNLEYMHEEKVNIESLQDLLICFSARLSTCRHSVCKFMGWFSAT